MSSLSLQNEQYRIYSTLCNTWGKLSDGKYPYFFLTGSAGTGKSFMTRQIINFLQSKNKNYLLIAPTGVAAQNIGGKTIHSSLKIRYWEGRYESLIFSNQTYVTDLQKIEALIIEEISMVDSDLFTFLSDIFSRVNHNNFIFGNVPTLVVGDLAQLPTSSSFLCIQLTTMEKVLPFVFDHPTKTNKRSWFL